jgi:hypothetical protein
VNKLLAICGNPKCGKVFDASGGIMVKNATATITNNSVQCPYCGSLGKTLDGTYNFDKDGFATLLEGPEFTTDVLAKLRKVAEDARANKYSPQQFIEEAEKISPAVAGLFLSPEFQAYWSMINTGLQTFFTFLGVLIATLSYLESKKEKNEKQPIVNVYVAPVTPAIKPRSPELNLSKNLNDSVKKKKRGRRR